MKYLKMEFEFSNVVVEWHYESFVTLANLKGELALVDLN